MYVWRPFEYVVLMMREASVCVVEDNGLSLVYAIEQGIYFFYLCFMVVSLYYPSQAHRNGHLFGGVEYASTCIVQFNALWTYQDKRKRVGRFFCARRQVQTLVYIWVLILIVNRPVLCVFRTIIKEGTNTYYMTLFFAV